jgi:DNA ligase-1
MPFLGVMLAKKYENTPKMRIKVNTWYLFSKYDGSRGMYIHKDKTFYSRTGKIITMPQKIIDEMPDSDLDGEFFGGVGTFKETAGFMRVKNKETRVWPKNLKFIVFDRPNIKGPYAIRMPPGIKFESKFLIQAPYEVITPLTNLEKKLEDIEKNNGEGLIFRNPETPYEYKRTSNLLKYTSRYTDEAVVIGYEMGTGRLEDMMGALTVESKGIQFKVGTGFSDSERTRADEIFPPGTIITFACKSFEETGKPREPSYITVRDYE